MPCGSRQQGAKLIHEAVAVLCPPHASGTGQQVFFQPREFCVRLHHAQVIAFQVVVGDVFHVQGSELPSRTLSTCVLPNPDKSLRDMQSVVCHGVPRHSTTSGSPGEPARLRSGMTVHYHLNYARQPDGGLAAGQRHRLEPLRILR